MSVMVRLGLCCLFLDEPIRFRAATATATSRLSRRDALAKLSGLCLENAAALSEAIAYCARKGIGAFRVNSRILPLRTHPEVGYDIIDLPESREILSRFRACGALARREGIRLSFHPDQFVLLGSPHEGVTVQSIAELESHAEISSWIGADVINIHGGGAYGDKDAALGRLRKNFRRLSRRVRRRLTLENDDRVYMPSDLLPVCRDLGIPLVYDVHHHRCLPDGLDEEEATALALGTWDREPLFHVSSPREGWGSRTPQPHHDFVALRDFPTAWDGLDATVDVEAKAKERAVLKLRAALRRRVSRVATR